MSDGRIVLCDFGLSAKFNEYVSFFGSAQHQTGNWIAPESRGSQEIRVSEKLDVWALGMIMFE